MPKHEPDASDPLELVAGGGEVPGTDCAFMAECLIAEFLSLGHGPEQVMALFRSPDYSLAHRAWTELGDVKVFTLVQETARALERARAARAVLSEKSHA